MKFLFNTVYYKPARGGGGPVFSVSSLAEALVKRGHTVFVAASDLDIPGRLSVEFGRDVEIEGVMVRYFAAMPTLLQRTGIPAFSKSAVFCFGSEFATWLNEVGPQCDVIHSHISYTWTNRPCSIYAARHRKVFLYHQRGNMDPIRLRRGRWKKMAYLWFKELPIMRRADALIALTARELDSFRALGLSNRIEVIPNGFDQAVREVVLSAEEFSSELRGITVDATTFLFLSRLHPVKGPEIFVDAFIQAARANREIHAMLAGPDEAHLVDGLLARVKNAGLSERFHYLGILHGDEKMDILQRADVFVLPTEAEGFSMVLLEALAAECAVLTTYGAYFPEIAAIGAGRILNRSVDEFAAGMLEMAKLGRPKIREMGRRGRDLVHSNYSWENIAVRYEALCTELVSAKQTAPYSDIP